MGKHRRHAMREELKKRKKEEKIAFRKLSAEEKALKRKEKWKRAQKENNSRKQ